MISLIKIYKYPLLLMAAIFLLSSIPGDLEGDHFALLGYLKPTYQNLLHIPLYGLLQYLWLRTFYRHGKKGIVIILICLGITLGYGILDELHQIFVPGRYGSMVDMSLNFLGGCIGVAVFLLIEKHSLRLGRTNFRTGE